MDGDFFKRSTLQGRVILEINNGCILWLLKSHKYLLAQGFIYDLQIIVHLRQLEGVSFVNRRYTKGVPFLSKMVCKRIRGGGKVSGPSSYNTLLSAPLAHYVPQREAVCSFAACYCHILCFLLFLVFNWNASIFLASKPHVRSSTFTSSINSHVTRHMSALDQLKAFLQR